MLLRRGVFAALVGSPVPGWVSKPNAMSGARCEVAQTLALKPLLPFGLNGRRALEVRRYE